MARDIIIGWQSDYVNMEDSIRVERNITDVE